MGYLKRGKMITEDEGTKAVHLARNIIETFLTQGNISNLYQDLPPIFEEKMGVFVTLTYNRALRGCIGRPYPDIPLKNAIVNSAISAAINDFRFKPVQISEMKDIIVEVTILSKPELLEMLPKNIPLMIEIGKHGLLIKEGKYQGLLLPQVAIENKLGVTDFLIHTCMKAGLKADAWLKGAEVYRFEGQVFKERVPNGTVYIEKFE